MLNERRLSSHNGQTFPTATIYVFAQPVFFPFHFAFGSAFVHNESHVFILCGNRFPQMLRIKSFQNTRAAWQCILIHTIDSNRDAANVELLDIAIFLYPFLFTTAFLFPFFLALSRSHGLATRMYAFCFRGGETPSPRGAVVVANATVELFTCRCVVSVSADEREKNHFSEIYAPL